MNPTQGPTWPGLALAALPMLGAMAVLGWRGLGQVRPLAVGATRLVFQMALLGLVLESIFAADDNNFADTLRRIESADRVHDHRLVREERERLIETHAPAAAARDDDRRQHCDQQKQKRRTSNAER